MESTRNVIREFVTTNFYVADPAQLRDDESLIDAGIIDSTGVLEVAAFLEERFGVRVDDADFRRENLDSIQRIEAFVARSRAAGARPSPGGASAHP
jgi:acyl carrier protein